MTDASNIDAVDSLQTDVNIRPAKPSGLAATLVGERRQLADPTPPTRPTTVPGSFLAMPPPPVEFTDSAAVGRFVILNLQQLQTAISKIAPVISLTGAFDDMSQYQLEFAADATPEQINAANAFLQKWPMVREQQRIANHNYELVDAWFKEQITAGFTTSRGFRLGLTTEDVALLTGNFVLAKSGAELGLPVPPIIDLDGIPHVFSSVEELTFLMLEYGQHRANLSAAYAAKKEAVRAELKRFNIDVAA